MTLIESMELMQKYAKCPKCGCEAIGNGKGTIEIDTLNPKEGYFRRTCSCGWCVEIKDSNIKD